MVSVDLWSSQHVAMDLMKNIRAHLEEAGDPRRYACWKCLEDTHEYPNGKNAHFEVVIKGLQGTLKLGP